MSRTAISAAVRDAVQELVLRELRPFGANRVEVLSTEDHEGDPAILVEVHYRAAEAIPDPRVASRLITKLNDLLYERGEDRFGYLRHLAPTARRAAAG